jgi:MFS family permease
VEGRGGWVASFALALAVLLALPLGLLATLWTRMALVEAVERECSMGVALSQTLGRPRRWWTAGAVLLVLGWAAWLAGLSLSASLLVFRAAEPLGSLAALRLSLAASLAPALLGAFPEALLEHAGWQALLALKLDEAGELPGEPRAPPPQGPVVDAEPVVEAVLVRPPDTSTH